ncbi:Cna B-type domain-containing protein, partial [Virgibacillus halodenitrificans]|nr:Cna B-type domain-containing protein [Virgibacillus halodenitrificans]
MQRRLSMLFICVLLFQTMISEIAPSLVKAEGKQQSIFTDSMLTDEEGNNVKLEDVSAGAPVHIHIGWSVKDKDIQADSNETLQLPAELEFSELQEGELGKEGSAIGTYQATTDGMLTVQISNTIENYPDANGTIVLRAVKSSDSAKTNEQDTSETPPEGETETSSPVTDENENTSTEPVAEEKNETEEQNPDKQNKAEKKEDPNAESTNETTKIEDSAKEKDTKKVDGEDTETEKNLVQPAAQEASGFNLILDAVTDLDGNPYTEESLLDPKDQFQLKLDWNLENGHTYKAGDQQVFQLPKGIKITEEMTGELKDATGLTVATYKITTDKKVELMFTDYVETHSNVTGWLQIISQLDEKNVDVEDGEAIIEPIGEEGEIRIPIFQGETGKTIEKKGTPNKGYNADEINWEVTINKNRTSLTNAIITDILPAGTEYKEGSLKVTKLKVDLYGKVLGDAEEVDVTGETFANGELSIPLGDITDAYRVEYITTVTDDEKKKFTNNAILSDDQLEDISAKSTATINRGEAIKKKAAKSYNPKTGIIEWEIEFNYNEKNLNDVTLKDAWTPAGKLELVEDSLKFTEVTIDEEGKAHATENVGLPEGAQLVPGTDQFEVTGITTTKPYKVTYKTKVKDRVLDSFTVKNTAGFGTEIAGSGTKVETYYGSKSAGTVDYKNKTIDWKIEVNHDEYPMENISIKDTLGEGLALKEDTLKVTVDGADYKDFSISGDNPFTIQFPNDFTTDKKIVITYQTSYVADEVIDHKPTNTAAITWIPEGGSESITKEVTAGTELNDKTKNNDWKYGSYSPETKEITWTIYTNYRENYIENLIVNDAPQENQKIVADSVVVKELAIDKKGNITEGDQITDGIIVDSEQNTLQVTIGKTNKAHKIEYKTSLAGLSDIQKEYVNKAEVLDGTNKLSDLKAEVGIVKAETYGEKSGYQDGKQVHWSVKVNLGQQKINNLKLVDTISANQEYLTNTIKVYKASVDTNGKATKGEEISPEQYELTHTTGEPDFTIIWKNEVERAFIVEYSTLFFEKHNGEVTNSYKVTGDSIAKDDENANGDGSVTIKQLASGGGNGEAGYLAIDKVDTTYGQEETSLEGAEFDLIDADTGNVLKSGTTNENGQIDFGRLLFGEYELHERVVPDGYVTKNERQTIVIDKKYEQNNEQTKTTSRVENFVPVYAIELLKTDNKGKALQDAEFTLYDGDKKELAKMTTDQDGKILFGDLKEAGTYYVQETKAPKGFVLDSTEHKVVIGDKEPEPVKVSITNKPRGAVVLTKKDLDSDIVLKGVEFALQKQDDTGDYQTIATLTTDGKGKIRTSNTLEAGNYQFVETKGLDGYRTNGTPIKFTVNFNSTKDQQLTMKNERYKGSVKLVKKDDVTDATLKNATFKLVKANGELVKENLTTNNQGELRIDDLFLGKYQLIETKAPAGYRLDETPIDIDITEDNQVIEKVMTNEKITDITVEKKWNNSSGDNESVTVKLLPTDQTVKLSEKNDWKATFKDLSVYDEAGEVIDYQVEELKVDGYNSAVTGDRVNGFIITNTETTTVEGTKTWLDDGSADRPDAITVKLLANGEKVATTEVKAANDWKYSFKDLDKYDANGEEIAYTIEEVPVEGYETTVNGFDLENIRIGTISVKGEKIWQDEDPTDRPEEITVNITRNIDGVEDKSFSKNKTVKPNNQGKWVYTFTDLAEFDENGAAYTYTVKETNVPEKYEAKIDGYDIINTRVGITEVSGKKRWKDDKISDRPETITINLLRNNVVVDTTQTTADDEWVYRFQDLPKYDNQGQLYDYTVKEQDVKGYDSQVSGFDITNTRAEKKSIEVTKGWLDDNSKDRPTSIIVYLKQNGELFDTVQLKAEDDWTYVFKDLEAYDENGQEYAYTVKEKALEGYETKIDGFNITNLRVGKTEVTGTKTWLDDNSKDRPTSITVKLLANGEETDKTTTVSADSDWKYAFTDLEKYDDQGKEIAYTVDEEAVEGYKKTISNNNITNLRVGKTAVTAEKIWNEVDERYRPDHVTINLLANGEVIDIQIVTADTDWMYTFSDLEKYDEQGKEITYTVEENDVPAGYDVD